MLGSAGRPPRGLFLASERVVRNVEVENGAALGQDLVRCTREMEGAPDGDGVDITERKALTES